jgi:hypothetical protein
MAKEQGIISSTHTDDEYRKLRSRVDDMTRRADDAQQALRTAEADLAALRAGVEPDAVTDPLDAVDQSSAVEADQREQPAPDEPAGEAAQDEHQPDEQTVEGEGEPPSIGSGGPVGGTWAASTQPAKGLSLRRFAGVGGRKSRGGEEPKR